MMFTNNNYCYDFKMAIVYIKQDIIINSIDSEYIEVPINTNSLIIIIITIIIIIIIQH